MDAPVIQALEKLKQERIVGAIGLGSNSVEFPGKLAETGRFDVIEIANGYTLLSQAIEDRILPAARKHDLGVIAGGAIPCWPVSNSAVSTGGENEKGEKQKEKEKATEREKEKKKRKQ